MMSQDLAILATRETIFFSYAGGKLSQWILVTLQNNSSRPMNGAVSIEARGTEVVTEVEIVPGVREYRCFAATLWPDHPPVSNAPVRLAVGEQIVTSATSVGTHRPWSVYLLSDVCTDYTWVYDDTELVHAHDAAVTEAELTVAEQTADSSEAEHNHYNLVHSREIEFFLEQYPDQAARLFDHIRKGTITLNPIFNMCSTGNASLEELIRQFYPARAWAMERDLDIGYANHQETPTIAWSMVAVLTGSGIEHLVKSILPYECPWAERLEEPPIYFWEGPDGSHILVRHRKDDYVEGNFVLRGLRATNTALHDSIIPRYNEIDEDYPFNAIGLVGCYGDLAPNTKDLPARKAATIAAYNAQGWDYPKLINASHKQFWDDIEDQIATRGIAVPVYKGDYGTSWEAWPACLANDFAAWRRAQERASMADKIAGILFRLNHERYDAHREGLSKGWDNLVYLADHAWNGANDANRALNASLRRQWQTAANQAFDKIINDGSIALSQRIPSGEEKRIVVFNSQGWTSTGVVSVSGIEANMHIIDVATGERMPTQVVAEGQQTTLSFTARDVPPVGYRVFVAQPVVELDHPQVRTEIKAEKYRLEGPYYTVEVSPITGAIKSLYDNVRGVELADPNSPYHINQCLFLSDGVEHTPQTASTHMGSCGPVFGQIVVRSALKNTQLTTTITLYTELDRIDIRNELEKQPTTEKQELDFVFPFRVPGRQYRFEAPGAIITPGDDQRPGSGQAYTAVRHFVDVFNDEFGVTLSQADSGIVEFGHRTTAEDPLEPDPTNGTVLALALENCIDWHEAIRDQAGDSQFVFRYSLRGHGGGFDPVTSVRFGWEKNNELLSAVGSGPSSGDLPSDLASFLSISPENILLTCLKVAEEDGLIVRLWECTGQTTEAMVSVSGLGLLREAWQTDLLENDMHPLAVSDNRVKVSVPANGFTTVRLLFE